MSVWTDFYAISGVRKSTWGKKTLADTNVEGRLRRGFLLVAPFQVACWDDPEEPFGSQGFY
jgi:hypothetical protein